MPQRTAASGSRDHDAIPLQCGWIAAKHPQRGTVPTVPDGDAGLTQRGTAGDLGPGSRMAGAPSCQALEEEDPQMDAIAMLKADHDKVKRLLTELESTTERA